MNVFVQKFLSKYMYTLISTFCSRYIIIKIYCFYLCLIKHYLYLE